MNALSLVMTQTRDRRDMSFLMVLVLGFAVLLQQTLPADAQDRPGSFADLAAEVTPAVVNITTTMTIAGNSGPLGTLPEGSPFQDFFRDFQGPGDGPRETSALGSGFVISADGFVVTNNHVIENADEIIIEFFSGNTLPATLVGTDPKTDIAVLKVDTEERLPFVPFGDSDAARVGDWVLAVGNPLGRGFSVSAGIISQRNQELSGPYDDFIQTDAAINRGNSGGPLFNLDGEVIGVNTAIISPTGGSIGLGFSMASNVVSDVVAQLLEYGETRRGWLGVFIGDVTEEMLSDIIGLDSPRGAFITNLPDGPAKDAGIQAGDVIVDFNGEPIDDTRELVRIVGEAPVGAEVDVIVLRNGEEVALTVTLGRRETSESGAVESVTPQAPEEGEALGMLLSTITPELSGQFGFSTKTGLVVIAVQPGSDAEIKGLEPGDVITEAGQVSVTSLSDLTDRIGEARDAGRKSLLLLVRRGDDPRFLTISLDN